MQKKVNGPLAVAAVVGALALIGILGYFVIGSTQAGTAADLDLAAKQQAARTGGRTDTTSSAEGRVRRPGQ